MEGRGGQVHTEQPSPAAYGTLSSNKTSVIALRAPFADGLAVLPDRSISASSVWSCSRRRRCDP